METILLLARHGNTFNLGEQLLRVGGRTDLPLVEDRLGTALGKYLQQEKLIPDVIYAAPLKRTMATAEQIIKAIGLELNIIPDECLIEIDYGPDEGKPEVEVEARLGKEALALWNNEAIVPNGWHVDPQAIITMWHKIALRSETQDQGKKVLIVTSNGILRFAPYITGDFHAFSKQHKIKVSTGGLCIFAKSSSDLHWTCRHWNLRV